jgi:C_GCAxxG_C_C family probable redox protein
MGKRGVHMNNKEKALSFFDGGFNCAQSVFSAYPEVTGIDEATAKKTSLGFGAGFGRLQETCGAITGAIMVLGAKYFNAKDVAGSKESSYAKVRELVRLFKEKNGSICCLDLLKVDLSTEGGMKMAREANVFGTVCRRVIGDACDILEKMVR